MTRRDFLKGAAVTSSLWVGPWARGLAEAPSERITVAVIGCGLMGMGHLNRCLGDPGVQVLAVCDVDRTRREDAQGRVESVYADKTASGHFRGCKAYNDYRDVIARPDLDAVLIATPDHWHAIISAHAAQSGKDVYCEKPISITIQEGRRLSEVIGSHARVFQTGTQYRSRPVVRRICQCVREGVLGRVKHVFTLWSRVQGSLAPVNPMLPAEPVPEGLDWDLWVGPAPWRPYNSAYHRNPPPGVVPWAFCEDFGVASVTWHHSHSADVIQYGLGQEKGGPIEILHPSSGEFPTLTYRYGNGTLLHLVEHWGRVGDLYDVLPKDAKLAGNFGGVFVGERGWITTMYGGGPIEGGPEGIFEEMGLKNREVSGANDHHANWFQCIKTRGRPSSDEEIGHRSASLGHLAIAAFKLERSLKWDPVKEEFLGDEQANRLRSKATRQPWSM